MEHICFSRVWSVLCLGGGNDNRIALDWYKTKCHKTSHRQEFQCSTQTRQLLFSVSASYLPIHIYVSLGMRVHRTYQWPLATDIGWVRETSPIQIVRLTLVVKLKWVMMLTLIARLNGGLYFRAKLMSMWQKRVVKICWRIKWVTKGHGFKKEKRTWWIVFEGCKRYPGIVNKFFFSCTVVLLDEDELDFNQ